MLRGVNKNIIEISETENKYFERVILFVRAEFLDKDEKSVNTKAVDYIKGLNPEKERNINIKYKKPFNWVGMAISGVLGAALTAIVFLII